ncbi:exodeoxyribonuclease VII large subunit [Myxococcus sp. AM009]|uniref:exodeoxyribonuclease VII large subunit n=1 Tax=unclassified Myxococcus TaxID=2648731 RepID=UPI0015955F0C|nr:MULTISPECIES: exodeoxyribonuclease VII large subunit [unclassified Myxococcus]NVJ03305.1 exodeoxyribonuclease VII large subunit [Myxococcus sp. AM009]NVJ18772.1 exodeoxyribonuclease VII large subunit [Myxococcus sp. AM010]
MTRRKVGGGTPPPVGQQGDLFGSGASTPRAAGAARKAAATPKPPPPPVDADGTSLLGPMEGAPPPPPKPERVVLSVGELTRQLKQTLESRFARVIVRGEVTGFRGPNARGHWYFSLKDSGAAIDAKVWASMAARLRFALRDGMEVIAEGSVDLYEPQGRYSLIVQRLEPVGEGALALAFEQLKERLAQEGLIGPGRVRPPRPLPYLPRRIGVVTSRTGAALQDFLRVLHSRNPRQSVLVADARVQGEGSAVEVARAIERLARTDVDVIVVTRGGGSVEDLWTFNEERVARAIFASPVPVVSAIGHEIDFTISDFVADLRAPTPSAAAERLAPVLADLELTLATQAGRLRRAMERRVLELREEQGQLASRLEDPRRAINHQRLHLSEQVESMMRVLRPAVRGHREALRSLTERLQRARPQARLGEQRAHLLKLAMRLSEAVRAGVATRHGALATARLGLERASPVAQVSRERARLAAHRARLLALQQATLADAQKRFQRLEGRLDAMSPLKVMSRGYSVVFRQRDGAVVRTGADVQVGERLGLKLASNGAKSLGGCEEIEATVTAVKGPVDC